MIIIIVIFIYSFWAADNAGELINPPKTAHQVEQETQDKHELYVRSHSSYNVGKYSKR